MCCILHFFRQVNTVKKLSGTKVLKYLKYKPTDRELIRQLVDDTSNGVIKSIFIWATQTSFNQEEVILQFSQQFSLSPELFFRLLHVYME